MDQGTSRPLANSEFSLRLRPSPGVLGKRALTWNVYSGLKCWYPQIIYFHRSFHYKFSKHPFWGTPIYTNNGSTADDFTKKSWTINKISANKCASIQEKNYEILQDLRSRSHGAAVGHPQHPRVFVVPWGPGGVVGVDALFDEAQEEDPLGPARRRDLDVGFKSDEKSW